MLFPYYLNNSKIERVAKLLKVYLKVMKYWDLEGKG